MASASPSLSAHPPDSPESPTSRFLLDLEFLTSLSSPAYLHHLAVSPPFVLDSLNFQLYLRYLHSEFAAKPSVAQFVKFPQCLEHLRLLINPDVSLLSSKVLELSASSLPDAAGLATPFALRLRDPGFRDEVHRQMFGAWRWRTRRLYGGGEHDFDVLEERNRRLQEEGEEAGLTSDS